MTVGARGQIAVLRQARNLLQERGEIPTGLVQRHVERSWRRSLASGLLPIGRPTEVPHLSMVELATLAERHQELIAHARPVIEHLHSQTRDSGSMVILSDEHGTLLQAMGDADFLTRAERVALMPGASWHEEHRGTNAIGTALAEGLPCVVHGAEHYLERNAFLTCAASPILAPDGRLLGVLDISGEQRSQHPHTFGLVRSAAQMIENRLFDAQHRDSIRLRFHTLAEGIGTVAEGVVALTEDGWVTGANQAALRLLGLSLMDLGATPVARVLAVQMRDLLDWARRAPGQSLLVNRPSGERLFVRVEPGRELPRVSARAEVSQTPPRDALAALDTGDPRLRAAIERARKVLGKQIPILLHGESGVGKELFANALHRSSARRDKPFVAVSCAAIPENLIEAELFGYAPGAFTGARRDGSPGRIREADGGTLFLDEIGDMPTSLQRHLLRVLQERQVTPLGGGRSVPVDFTLICATHRDLRREMDAGRFRPDLYYRINGLTLTLPNLRERGDLPALTAKMIEQAAPGRGIELAPTVSAAFDRYTWPGNLRQLNNALRTACAMLDEDERLIDWSHLPDDVASELQHVPPAWPSSKDAPSELENLRALSESAVHRAVGAVGGNISEAARRLGISRNTLYRKLRRRD